MKQGLPALNFLTKDSEAYNAVLCGLKLSDKV